MEVEITTSRKILDITQYRCYRKFINDWFINKKVNRSFSYRQFSSQLGLSSPNYMQLVIKGERNLSLELASKLTGLMKLTSTESDFFLGLIEYSHCSDATEKLVLEKRLLRNSRKIKTNVLQEMQIEILQSWQHMLVRELIFLPTFKLCPDWICEVTDYLINFDEATRSIEVLTKCGHWTQDLSGNWKASETVVDTGDQVFSRTLMNDHHAQTLKKWSDWMEVIDPDLRELGLLHVPINKAKIPELKKRIRNFQDEIIGWLQDEKEADTLIQLGTYLIPLKKS
jgi:uncharacterized protein (TIGR02147 family)